MTVINRRNWMQQSLLASSTFLISANTSKIQTLWITNYIDAISPLPLHWNENPYGPSEKAILAMMESLKKSNRYPDATVEKLKLALAEKYSVGPDQLMITAGSTELLCLCGQHVGLTRGEILTPWPSFPTMMMFGQQCGAKINKIPLGNDNVIDLNRLADSINDHTSLIFICNPNNPTSTELDFAQLRTFCRNVSQNILIFIDEAYIEFSKNGQAGSMVSLVNELPNLIIGRTFSKAYGLAGQRIGYAISQRMNIDELTRRHAGRQLSTSITSLTGALASLRDYEFLEMCVRKNQEGRSIVYKAFDHWGVQYNPSSTNFIYARSSHFDPDVRSKLKDENILITKWPDMKDHIRISVGKPDHMHRFVEVVEQFLA